MTKLFTDRPLTIVQFTKILIFCKSFNNNCCILECFTSKKVAFPIEFSIAYLHIPLPSQYKPMPGFPAAKSRDQPRSQPTT